jgi:hypothetical protein
LATEVCCKLNPRVLEKIRLEKIRLVTGEDNCEGALNCVNSLRSFRGVQITHLADIGGHDRGKVRIGGREGR